jgi:hypothetical protein
VATQRGERNGVKLAGGLLVGGLLINVIVTMFHPSGDEDNHEKIFTEYAESDAWEIIHLGQTLGLLLAIAGILVLCRLLSLRGAWSVLATLIAASAVITGAVFVILQGLDGVGLKEASDTWLAAGGPERAERLHDAETIRWLEWGFQSYFRAILGITLILLGAGIAFFRLLPNWLGWLAIVAGALSIALGIDVGYQGLASGVQDVLAPLFQFALLIFAIGVIVAGSRRRDASDTGFSPPA